MGLKTESAYSYQSGTVTTLADQRAEFCELARVGWGVSHKKKFIYVAVYILFVSTTAVYLFYMNICLFNRLMKALCLPNNIY